MESQIEVLPPASEATHKEELRAVDQLLNKGDSAAALKLAEAIYGKDRNNVGAMLRLARCYMSLRRSKDSLLLYDQCSKQGHPFSLTDMRYYAISCAENNRASDAERYFKQALSKVPNDPLTLENLVRFYLGVRKYFEAIGTFFELVQTNRVSLNLITEVRRILRKQNEKKKLLAFNGLMMAYFPKERSSHFDSARLLLDLNLVDQAAIMVRDVHREDKNYKGVDELAGVIATRSNHFLEAEKYFSQGFEKDPKNFVLVLNYARLLIRKRDGKKASEILRPFIDAHYKTNPEFREILTQALTRSDQSDEAIRLARTLYDREPGRIAHIDILSACYLYSHRFEEGITFLEKVLRAYGEPPSKLFHRYLSHLMQSCQYQRALDVAESYVAKNPKDIRAVLQAAFAALNVNEFEKGWKYYDRRTEMNDDGKYFFRRDGAVWKGEDIRDKTLLLIGEQGLGDVIMVSRFIPAVRKLCRELIIEVQRPIHELIGHNFKEAKIFRRGGTLPHYDVQLQMMSVLPRLNVNPKTMIGRKGYLSWDKPYSFKRSDKFTVAFAWQGEANHPNDINRSFSLGHLEPIFRAVGSRVQFVSIQRGVYQDELDQFSWAKDVIKLGNRLNSLCDTAGLLKQIDLVLCCDSAPIHLAGAMGRPAWCLVNTPCEWRWTPEGEKTYWYNSLLIKRVRREDKGWEPLMARLAKDLLVLVDKHEQSR